MSLVMIKNVPFEKRKELVDEVTQQLNITIEDVGSISDEQLEQAVSDLGYLNDFAYKGYRKLKDEWRAINDRIYAFKNEAVIAIAKEFKKRDKDVSYGAKENVVYFRRDDGIQISFHIPTQNDEETSFYASLPSGEWDRVEHAYSFTDLNEYKMIIEQRKEAEIIATEIANKHKEQNVKIVISYLRGCSDWRLAYVYKMDPKSDMSTCVEKMEGKRVRPYISSFRSDAVVHDALGNYEKEFFDEVDKALKEHGLPFKMDHTHYTVTQTKMGKRPVGTQKTKTTSRKKVA